MDSSHGNPPSTTASPGLTTYSHQPEPPAPEGPPRDLEGNYILSYPQFLWKAAGVVTEGNLLFYAWMTALTAIMLVGVNAWAHQVVAGLDVTALTDQVSWGMYIGNFTYGVGLAAGAVMMVIPAYVYHDHEMHDVVIIGEILAISAIAVCIGFVSVDIGKIEHIWHLAPFIGVFHWPMSMLTWDIIVLNGYLFLNAHVSGYLLYMRFLGRKPDWRWYLPFVFISIMWAVSIHTVTAFLYCGLGGRPFWNTAILAPRFIVSAFVTGPAFIIMALQVVRRVSDFHVGDGAIDTLMRIVRVTSLLNLFLVVSEVFTQFYTGGVHEASAEYLFFGLHGHHALVPFIWTAIAFNVIAASLFHLVDHRKHLWPIDVACILTLTGIWIEKGLGLIVPGFVPSTLHEIVEYLPDAVEWKVSLGLGAMGLIIFTLGLKLAVAVFTDRMHVDRS